MALRLKDLHEKGYIDWKGNGEFPRVKYDLKLADPLREAYPEDYEYSPTLPAFRKDNWKGLRDGDYEALLPSIRVASCILCEPSVLTFFIGLLSGSHEEINDNKAKSRLNVDHLYRFESVANDPINYEITGSTLQRLHDMEGLIKLKFGPIDGKKGSESLAATDRWSGQEGLSGYVRHVDKHTSKGY